MFYIMLKSAATHFTSLFAQSTVTNNETRQTHWCVTWGFMWWEVPCSSALDKRFWYKYRALELCLIGCYRVSSWPPPPSFSGSGSLSCSKVVGISYLHEASVCELLPERLDQCSPLIRVRPSPSPVGTYSHENSSQTAFPCLKQSWEKLFLL